MSRVVRVRRTGGFAGLSTEGEADADDVPELADLLERIDAGVVDPPPATHADRYTYAFDLDGATLTVPEQHLTDDLRRVAAIVLG